ncbi:M48 family metalloprotease [Krasilnikovia sp. MM14-A1004]|uniref:M48 family metalloprotease n=1 Tax=Krasilnikovia sp. MM14-A1004 TaxID=3373541 RepID=UPI00399D41C4
MIVETECPACGTALTSLPEAEPWCGSCEWNLDLFLPDPSQGRMGRRIGRAQHRAGFRSDLLLALSTADTPVTRGPHRALLAVSALLMAVVVAAFVTGAWLIAVHDSFLLVLLGLVVLGVGAAFRPRFGRLKPLLEHGYRIEPGDAPAVHGLIDRVAASLDVPAPDVVILDSAFSAGVATVGLRRRRVLVLGVPLLLALRPQQVVALIGHELGHLKYDDNRRALLTQPARTTFGRLSNMVRPHPRLLENGTLTPPIRLLIHLVGGTVSWLLWGVHVGLNTLAKGDDRRVELRADAMSARAAGTTAALETLDVLAMLPSVTHYVTNSHVPEGEAATKWRGFLRVVQDREAETASAWRQLSIRTRVSLFASHPAPGRRHQWLSGQPVQEATVVPNEAESARIEQEIAPYAEAMHRTMLDAAPWRH